MASAVGSRAPHPARGVGTRGGPARRANRQQRSRPSEPGSGTGCPPRPCSHLTGYRFWGVLSPPRATAADRGYTSGRRHAARDGVDRDGRRPRARQASARRGRAGSPRGTASGDSRLARWARHATEVGSGLHAGSDGGGQRKRRRSASHLDRDRSLLRDGSRQALGADQARVRCHGERNRRPGCRSPDGDQAGLRCGRDRRVRQAARHQRRAPPQRRRRDLLLQLSRRSHAPDRARARRSGVRRVRCARPPQIS